MNDRVRSRLFDPYTGDWDYSVYAISICIAQLNYLTHYTCILLGLSLEDLTSLRLLRYANLERSSEKVYWIKAGDGGEDGATQLRLLIEYFETQNLCVVNDADGYSHFYHTLMETVKHKGNGK